MDEERRKRVRANASGGEVDWLRNLPEALQWHVLLNLPTKDVVKTSIIYSKWRHLWRYVPGLDLDCRNFKEYNVVVSFIDKFLSFNSESALKKFKLRYNCVLDRQVTKETKTANLMRWINDVVNRKVQHLDVWWGEVDMPPTLYKCESLVSLKLAYAILPNPESVSLPSVKVLDLLFVKFANDLAFERLISGCICLETLTLDRSQNDNVRVLQVSSKSLLSFRYNGSITKGPHDDLVVSIDTPKLEELQISDHLTASFIIADLSSLVEADIDVQFNFCFGKKFNPLDLPKGKMINNFLVGISNAKKMIISPTTLEESATFSKEGASIVTGPWRLLSSLEYVEIESPLEGDKIEMEFVRYLLENSPILKKVTLYLEKYSRKKSFILIELLKIRRCSTSCEVVVM
ncbi:hypothetical protein CARUB_v10022031mg [Capsella rubella]|uniref:FBD domain-containing protein n=1 Tax=Capsella rubella TaxID=81985 RepID=R0I8T9_9BRAS|nr:hypothetical protein CARUB_v10022031mg [Capsella rubella]